MCTESVYRKVSYNEEQINNVIESFKSRHLKPEDVTIIFDMDNTLCLYSVNGDDETALKQMWNKNYYKNLPCFAEAPSVIEALQRMGFRIKILSACISSKYCRKEKMDWIHYHLSSIKDEDILLVENGENKSKYIEDIYTTILIDDYYKNIMNWYDAGGVAVKKTFSGKQRPVLQVNSLVEIFNILWDLEIIGSKN